MLVYHFSQDFYELVWNINGSRLGRQPPTFGIVHYLHTQHSTLMIFRRTYLNRKHCKIPFPSLHSLAVLNLLILDRSQYFLHVTHFRKRLKMGGQNKEKVAFLFPKKRSCRKDRKKLFFSQIIVYYLLLTAQHIARVTVQTGVCPCFLEFLMDVSSLGLPCLGVMVFHFIPQFYTTYVIVSGTRNNQPQK